MREIFRREFLGAFLSGRFAVGLLSSVGLFAFCAFFFVSGYREAPVPPMKPSTKSILLAKPASPLGFCIQDAGASAALRPGSGADVTVAEGERNFQFPPYVRFDWAFLTVVVFGVMGVVLSYSAINGEKEDGTLRQVLANPIPRSSIFTGKYLALTIAATWSLLTGALIGLLVVAIWGPGGMSWAGTGSIFVFLLFACLFISLIVLLSLTVSSLTHRSDLAALVLLTVWAVWTFLIPGLSHLLASEVRPLPSDLEIASRLGPMINGQVWGTIGTIRKRVEDGELKTKEEVLRLTDEAFIEGQKKLIALRDEISRAREARLEAARDISRTSPSAAFRYGTEAILDLGVTGLKHFRRDAERYSRIYDQYVISKMGKLVVTSDWSFGTNMRVAGEFVKVDSPQAEEYTGDMSDFPEFTRSRRSFVEALSEAAPDLAILLGWNAVLFVLGLVAFNRYDVR